VEKSTQSSQAKVQELLQELHEMFCTLKFRLNSQIQHTVKRYWSNAITFLKESLRTSKKIQSPEAVFVAACKGGRKAEWRGTSEF
jgi:hypothetical protein